MRPRLALNTIQARIAIGEGILITGLVVVALLGIAALRTVRNTVTRETTTLARISTESSELLLTLLEEMQAAEEYFTNGSSETGRSFVNAGEASHRVQQRLMTLPQMSLSGRLALGRIAALQTEAEALYSLAHAQVDIGRSAAALATAALARSRTGNLIDLVRNFSRDQETRAAASSRELEETARERELMVWTVLVASIFVGISIGLATLRSVERPLTRLAAAAQKFGDGDLRPVVLGSMPDELADLGTAMGRLGETLRTVVSEVVNESERIAETADNISSIGQQVSGATSDVSTAMGHMAEVAALQTSDLKAGIAQAKGLQSFVEDADRGGKQLVDLSTDIRELARTYRYDMETAHSSLAAVGTLVKTTGGQIEELEELSEPIYRFVDLIKQISSQTNLLALNAAIEAARAGEKGIGFAVVADEVRQLADSSAQAAEEVSGAIKRVRDQVAEIVKTMELSRSKVRGVGSTAGDSVKILDQMVEAVQKIDNETRHISDTAQSNLESVEEVRRVLSDAADAATERAESSGNVASTIGQQKASTEEMAARSAELSQAAEHLQSLVQLFRT